MYESYRESDPVPCTVFKRLQTYMITNREEFVLFFFVLGHLIRSCLLPSHTYTGLGLKPTIRDQCQSRYGWKSGMRNIS